jgi:hypothetical protein
MIDQDSLFTAEQLNKIELLLSKAIKIENAACGAVQIYNPVTNCLQLVHHCGLESLFVEPYDNINSGSDTVCARAFRMASGLMIAEVGTDVFYKRLIESGTDINFNALHCAPIFSTAGEVIGILTTYYKKSFHLSSSAIESKNLIAAEIAPIFETLIKSHSQNSFEMYSQ